ALHRVTPVWTLFPYTTLFRSPSAVGQVVNFTFTVVANAPGSGTPTGNVTISDGTQSCSASVGTGSCSIAFSSAGARNVTATYPGDGELATDTPTPVGLTVGPA